MTQHDRNKTRVRYHRKLLGQPFGVYTWSRRNKAGIILRAGPLGHAQAQIFRYRVVGSPVDNRRHKHGVGLYVWGTKNRRRKLGIELTLVL